MATALNPLLDFARSFVPRAQWSSTPLVLKATAGLRAVEPARAARVIDAVADVFSNSGFMFERNWAGIISGNEEGGLAWVTANYLKGTFLHDGPATNDDAQPVGIIEMGGGSTQVAFRMHDLKAFDRLDDDPSRPKRRFMFTDISGRRHNVYALSYLGFGQDHAQRRLAAQLAHADDKVDPCYRPAYTRDGSDGAKSSIRGGGNFDQCMLLVRNVLFSPTMPDQPPLIPGQTLPGGSSGGVFVQPHLAGKFIATENYWYTRRSADIQPEASLSLDDDTVHALGKRFCADSSGEKDASGQFVFDRNNRYCFGLAFQTVLLEELSAVGVLRPTITKNIGGSDLDWALGAAVVHFSTHEKQLTRLWGGHGWTLLPRGSARGAGADGDGGRLGYVGSVLFHRPLEVAVVLAVALGLFYYFVGRRRRGGGVGGKRGKEGGAKRRLTLAKGGGQSADFALAKSV